MIFPKLAAVFPILIQQLIGAVVGLFVIYSNILDEQIGDFQVTLLPIKSAFPSTVTPVSIADTGSNPTIS